MSISIGSRVSLTCAACLLRKIFICKRIPTATRFADSATCHPNEVEDRVVNLTSSWLVDFSNERLPSSPSNICFTFSNSLIATLKETHSTSDVETIASICP